MQKRDVKQTGGEAQIAEGGMPLGFRPLTKRDFGLFAQWLGRPHVNKWWREPATVEHVAKEYGACTDGDLTTRVFVVMECAKPIGIIQVFRLDSYPEYLKILPYPEDASIDYLIGEEQYLGRGYGTRMITDFIETVVRPTYPGASGVTTSAEVGNLASLGALANSGFVRGRVVIGEFGTAEQEMRLKL